MTPERWEKVEAALQAALDQTPADRTALLSTWCSGDEALRQEATSLLAAYDEAGEFLEEPAIASDAELIVNQDDLKITDREIGPYKIIQLIGTGGMGEIYLAQDLRLDRLVALKVLHQHPLSNHERIRRFQTEARAASALNHPNILTIYDVGEFEHNLYLAAEYVEGQTVRELIAAGGLSLGEVIDLSIELLEGLSAAHAASIIHRDIKPENIMRRTDGRLKILDFGIAKLLEPTPGDTDQTLTETGMILGTVGYMSPEQVRCLAVDERTDVWSCGVVLYEMLTQHQPFRELTNADTLVAMLKREPPPVFENSRHRDRILARIENVVQQALKKDPNSRYQSAAAMRVELESIRNLIPHPAAQGRDAITSTTPVAALRQISLRATTYGRQKFLLAGVALLLLLLVGAVLIKKPWTITAPNSTAAVVVNKPYLQMNDAERLAFVATEEQRISAMMGDHPVKLNDEAVEAIKRHVDRYAARSEGLNQADQDSLQTTFARAAPQIPVIVRAFTARKIPIVIGIYLPMVESRYQPCYENDFGAKGLFQFLPSTAERYGVKRSEMCDVEKVAPAAAHYLADRMAELGDDSQSMTLVLLSYNRGVEPVQSALRQLRETDQNYERNFWTLFANRKKLDANFQNESAGYVPDFFAAAIIGENPATFDLRQPALSTLASSAKS